MDILIIGGTGLTGKNIVKMLLDLGHRVKIFHRGEHPLELATEYLEQVTEIIGDRDNPEDIQQLAGQGVDILIDMVLKTEKQAKNLVKVFQGRLKHCLVISSIDVYRVFDVILGKDHFIQTSPLREDAPLRNNLYPYETDYDKIVVEKVILEAESKGDFPATILRFPAIYGPGQDIGLFREWFIVQRIIDGCFKVPLPDGARTYFHHGFTINMAYAVILIVENYMKVDTIYHVGDEDVLTTRQIFELAEEVFNVNFDYYSIPYEKYAEMIEGNPYLLNNHMLLDLTKIKHDLGFQQQIPTRTAMQKTFEWLKANPRSKDYLINVKYETEHKLIEMSRSFYLDLKE